MKKERKLRLEIKKVSISKLNGIHGGGDPLEPSVNLPCVITTLPKTIPDEDCKTGDTKSDESKRSCIVIGSRAC